MAKAITLPKLKAKLQLVFNAYIRARDKGKPCISCGKPKDLQAGHFYPVRMYDGLRFNEDNCHGECAGCNGFDDMHLLGYCKNLKERIGENAFERLKTMAGDYKRDGYKWSRSELIDLLEYYTNKLRELNC
jgi:hypothetical protein